MNRPSNRAVRRVVPLAFALVVAACSAPPRAHEPSPAPAAVSADPEMPRCPIGSPGITITATAGSGGTDLSLLASKSEDVQEVRRRTHASLAK